MEITSQHLLEIFKAGFRVGENRRIHNQSSEVVASNSEIEADAIPIITNIIKRELRVQYARQGGKTLRASIDTLIRSDPEAKQLYQGVF
jgi:hypothetical protein